MFNFGELIKSANDEYIKDPKAFREKHMPRDLQELLDKQETEFLKNQGNDKTIFGDK